MSILIKGMEMPKKAEECRFFGDAMFGRKPYCYVRPGGSCHFPEDCPLVPIPPHGRLIDADEISKHKYATIPPYRKEYSDGKPKSEDEVIAFKFGWNDAIDAIVANAPTIIEAEGGE